MTWFSNLPGGDKKTVVEYQCIHAGTSLPHNNTKHTKHQHTATDNAACGRQGEASAAT